MVAKDIASYTIVGGNPATVIKQRFSPEIVAGLETLAWWDQDIEWITKNIRNLTVEQINVEQIKRLINSVHTN